MDKVFTVVVPLFAMIFAGYWIVRLEVIGKETVKGLVGVVFWLFLPCFIFIKTLGTRDHGELDWALLGAYYLACLVTFMIAAVGGRLIWGGNARVAGLRGLSSISGVVGYMGLPLMVMAFGDEAALPTLMITMADNLVILAGGALIMELTEPREARDKPDLSRVLLTTGKSIISNPLILAVALAALCIALQWRLPGPLQIFATQMTNATGPLALVALGAAFAVHRQQNLIKGDSLALALLKVVVLPVLVFVSARYVFGLGDFLVKIAVIMAALPVAVNVFILASRYKTYEIEVSSSMLLSAVMGIGVISGLLVVLD
ncbi:auxin efflux carrier [Pseudomonas protegens]|uniref:AEC family transporter n=1 Tax=Pseudomonas TaxID=286 RepID=UPI001010FE2C|nr:MULTISPECIES: AEC family transporter [Pseudomonas]RXU67840.1 auxin efflux carrier [Pseudomonas protegens]ULT73357.1 AEC family transporter [Pseudomonas sp. BC42]